MKLENKKIHIYYLIVTLLLFGTVIYLLIGNNSNVKIGKNEKELFIEVDFSKYNKVEISDGKSKGRELLMLGEDMRLTDGEITMLFRSNKGTLLNTLVGDKDKSVVYNFDGSRIESFKYSENFYETITNYNFKSEKEVVDRVETLGDIQVKYKISKDGTIKVESVKKVEPVKNEKDDWPIN